MSGAEPNTLPDEEPPYIFADWDLTRCIYGIHGISGAISQKMMEELGHDDIAMNLSLGLELLAENLYKAMGSESPALRSAVEDVIKRYQRGELE